MPLVVFCGQPLSGKSTICRLLRDRLTQRGVSVDIISRETTLGVDGNEAFKGSSLGSAELDVLLDEVSHKNTRSGLRSGVERALSDRQKVVIVDALNNIKGCRYEIWCLARTAATRYCLIHVDTSEDHCRAKNSTTDRPYRLEILEDLLKSFERPESRNRWESPLFTIRGEDDVDCEVVLEAVVKLICGETTIQSALVPTEATSNPPLAETNLQHNIDRTVQDIITRLSEIQSEVGGEAVGTVSFGANRPSLHLNRAITITELRRLKRGFLKLATQITQSKLTNSDAAARLFIEYLQQNLND